mmetsp:Transcript_61002/g.142802  ORF Transcript_61002/g.142802 Transcript_61002/m.142802 type:complete len:203 (+) Transcript_61002:1134-1742(+)
MHGICPWLLQRGGDCGQRGSQTYKGVEGRHQLRKGCDLHLGCYGHAQGRAGCQDCGDLRQHRGTSSLSIGQAKCARQSTHHAAQAHGIAELSGLLGAKPTDGPDAHERRDEVDHLALRSQVHVAKGGANRIEAYEKRSWKSVHLRKLGHVCTSLEHVDHSPSHDEASSYIDHGDQCSSSCQPLRQRLGHVASSHHEDTANNC